MHKYLLHFVIMYIGFIIITVMNSIFLDPYHPTSIVTFMHLFSINNTIKYGPLCGLTYCSFGGLLPSADAFVTNKKIVLLSFYVQW